MRNAFFAVPFALAAFATPVLLSSEASASNLSACGNLSINANATCEVKVSGGCDVACTPFNASLQCEGKCQGGCKLTLPQCNIDCKAGCNADCKVNPPAFDCQVKCEADASAKCSAKCSSSTDKTQCDASCKATFKAECGGKCNVVPGSATCDAKCDASCTGSCSAQANLDCQIKCQGGCVAEVSGGCKAKCKAPEGALFCDGQFIDTNAAQSCLDAVAQLKITVYGSAACSGNTCEAKAGVSCNASPSGPSGATPWLVLASCVAGLAFVTRRRK